MEASPALNSSAAVAAIRVSQHQRLDGLALAHIITAIGEHYQFEFEDVHAALCSFPDNIIDLACSPEGVSALGDAIAQTLMGPTWDYPLLLVTIH